MRTTTSWPGSPCSALTVKRFSSVDKEVALLTPGTETGSTLRMLLLQTPCSYHWCVRLSGNRRSGSRLVSTGIDWFNRANGREGSWRRSEEACDRVETQLATVDST